MARNPCRLVEAPRLGQASTKALSEAQARAVIAAVRGRRNGARWSAGLAVELQQGEALGLRRDYPDLDAGELRVWYQLQRLSWRPGCDDPAACCERWHKRPCPRRCPKAARRSGRRHACTPAEAKGLCPAGCTGHAAQCPQRQDGGLIFREIKERRRKTVRLAPELVTALQAQHAERDAERAVAGSAWEDHDLVFCQPNGRPADNMADLHEWAAILAEAGIPHAGTHVMRHSAATRSIRA